MRRRVISSIYLFVFEKPPRGNLIKYVYMGLNQTLRNRKEMHKTGYYIPRLWKFNALTLPALHTRLYGFKTLSFLEYKHVLKLICNLVLGYETVDEIS